MISKRSRALWQRLPIGIRRKHQIRKIIFQMFPLLFRGDPAYQAWLESRADADEIPLNVPDPDPKPLLDAEPLARPPVQLIAFYLPQFHPIEENDKWWGRGFTEWNNVVRAKPKFAGHYQPRLPGELGFYDLRVPEVQLRQIELAKLYGIGGFAFYFYWFGGKRLLEAPLKQFLNDPNRAFPFCLCWANENWSRRWDGRHNDLLITQKHSPADDLAFIEYISVYLRDPRYIRVRGMPLLIIYRPDLLPTARETAQRWRTWCRSNGIGEIYLAYTQSFEACPPEQHGFDAAIEFPPNNSHLPLMTSGIAGLDPKYRGLIFDWRPLLTRSRAFETPTYELFRGVNPSWDNEARRPNAGAVYFGSSPEGYQEWLTNAARETLARNTDPSERLVFINAWNEWAEGAYLEPDDQNGYAYLHATRNALCSLLEPRATV